MDKLKAAMIKANYSHYLRFSVVAPPDVVAVLEASTVNLIRDTASLMSRSENQGQIVDVRDSKVLPNGGVEVLFEAVINAKLYDDILIGFSPVAISHHLEKQGQNPKQAYRLLGEIGVIKKDVYRTQSSTFEGIFMEEG